MTVLHGTTFHPIDYIPEIEKSRNRLAPSRNGGIVAVSPGDRGGAETTAGEGLPEDTLVGTRVPVGIGLDPGGTGVDEGRVARLELERVDEEVQPDGVSTGGIGVGLGVGGVAVGCEEGDVHVVQGVGPDLTKLVDTGGGGQAAVAQRVGGAVCVENDERRVRGREEEKDVRGAGVGVTTDVTASCPRAEGEVGDGGAGGGGPVSHSITPALTETSRLGGGQATSSSSTGDTVGETVGVLVDDDVVLEVTITVGLSANRSSGRVPRNVVSKTYSEPVPEVHPHLTGLAIRGSSEVGVVEPSSVLDGDLDTIVAASTLSEVVGLEVVRGLGEAVEVPDVVEHVGDIEGVDTGGVNVDGGGGSGGEGSDVVKDEASGGLGGHGGGGALVGDGVVSGGGGTNSGATEDPD